MKRGFPRITRMDANEDTKVPTNSSCSLKHTSLIRMQLSCASKFSDVSSTYTVLTVLPRPCQICNQSVDAGEEGRDYSKIVTSKTASLYPLLGPEAAK
mmetsp:Transcript_42295/g.70551  ORF Transcript_42295/g.70551 Transcript_42295/m.70551 type:complete len:98 (-) Transcript_42295:704-997(-)